MWTWRRTWLWLQPIPTFEGPVVDRQDHGCLVGQEVREQDRVEAGEDLLPDNGPLCVWTHVYLHPFFKRQLFNVTDLFSWMEHHMNKENHQTGSSKTSWPSQNQHHNPSAGALNVNVSCLCQSVFQVLFVRSVLKALVDSIFKLNICQCLICKVGHPRTEDEWLWCGKNTGHVL